MSDLERDPDFVHGEIVEHAGAWWALIAPDPPLEAMEHGRDMVFDAWDSMSEPPEAWVAIGPCSSPRHAGLQVPDGADWRSFRTYREGHPERDQQSTRDFYAAVIARARPPVVSDDPDLRDPVEPPPNPPDAPTHAYTDGGMLNDVEIVEEDGLERDAWLYYDLDALRRSVHELRASPLRDESEPIHDRHIWKVDLRHARFTGTPGSRMVMLTRDLAPEHIELHETIPGRPGSEPTLGELLSDAVRWIRSRIEPPPDDSPTRQGSSRRSAGAGRTVSMDENTFWAIIDESRSKTGGDTERHAEQLEQRLEQLEPEEIGAWEELWEARHRAAYRWDLWAAAYVLMGGCSDDSFADFRSWLIGQGRRRYESAVADPDSLADLVGQLDFEELDGEPLGFLGLHVYERVTGQELPLPPGDEDGPEGTEWDEDDVADVVPRIAAAVDW